LSWRFMAACDLWLNWIEAEALVASPGMVFVGDQ
jgi:hypothetical protein